MAIKELLYLDEVSERVGCSKRTIRRWILRGVVNPQRNFRGILLFTEDQVEILDDIVNDMKQRYNR